jgi:hypothetical protein
MHRIDERTVGVETPNDSLSIFSADALAIIEKKNINFSNDEDSSSYLVALHKYKNYLILGMSNGFIQVLDS